MKPTLEELLYPLGITNRYRGYPYFIMAVTLAVEDPTRLSNVQKEIYLPIALEYHANPVNVERALRTIRYVVLRNGGPEFLKRLNGGTTPRNATPYPTELIDLFARFLNNA